MSSDPDEGVRNVAERSAARNAYLEREREERERRWKATWNEITQILKHVPDIRLRKLEELPPEVGAAEKSRLLQILFESLLEGDPRPELKRSVVRRVADKLGNWMLWNRLSSTPGMHEIYALLPWWISKLPLAGVRQIRDVGLAYLMDGSVLPLQQVWRDLLDARAVYLGHCVCRSSGIAGDLPPDEPVRILLDDADCGKLLDRLARRFDRLCETGDLEGTDAAYLDMFEELTSLRGWKSPKKRIEWLLRQTYPDWEFLPVHGSYTQDWVRSMYHNRKARPLHRELAFELSTILFFCRGILFNTMRLMDTPYTICACPSPEHGGGCVLSNWYYYGKSDAYLLPNEEHAGRRRDARGFVQPCRYFEGRATRECVGCGCMHDRDDPRDLDAFLREADRVLRASRRHREGAPPPGEEETAA